MKIKCCTFLFSLVVCLLPVAYHLPHETNNLIKIDPGDSLEEIVRKSTLLVPNERQYAWMENNGAWLKKGISTILK